MLLSLDHMPSTLSFFAILPTTGESHQCEIQVKVTNPNILTSTDSVTATVIVAVDVTHASSNDYDPIIGISDGISFVGFEAKDGVASPCNHFEGDSNTNVLQNRYLVLGPVVTSQHYSSEIKIQIIPVEQWGSCHTEHDEGYTNIANYQCTLDPIKGLYLEWYHGGINEKHHIKYITVDADLD